MKEFDIHQQIISAVDPHNTDARIQHVPNPRSFAEYKLGYKGGWPDIVISMPFCTYGVEVKRPKEYCDTKQLDSFISLCLVSKFKIFVVDNADAGVKLIRSIFAERNDVRLAMLAREAFIASPCTPKNGELEPTFEFYYHWQGKCLPKCYRDALYTNRDKIWRAARFSVEPNGDNAIAWAEDNNVTNIF